MIRIEQCQSIEQVGWLPLRQALWPEASVQAHRDEIQDLLKAAPRTIHFVA